jgi:predicted DNA-binding protein
MNRLLYGVPVTTSLPRLQVTIDPELGAVLKALSELRGKPQASIIRELMLEAVPALEEVVGALRLAQTSPQEAIARMVKMADASVVEVNQATLPFRRKTGRPRKRV